jgi:hypothetical protein
VNLRMARVRMDGAEQRRERYAIIAQAIQAALHQSQDGFIPLKKTITLFKVQMGLTSEKVREYMNDLESLGQFEMDDANDQIRKPKVA